MSFVFIFAMVALGSASQAVPLKVLIDPGHGGSDHGAVRDTLRECDITLEISEKVAHLLARHPKEFVVHLTRDSDIHLPLSRRTEIAHETGSDVMISIHV